MSAKRTPLNVSALKSAAHGEPSPEPQVAQAQRSTAASRRKRPEADEAQKTVQASRLGKVQIAGHFPKEVKRSLRMLQAKTDKTTQELLEEALVHLFRKYNVPVALSDHPH